MKKLLSVSLCLLFAASLTAQTGKIRVATVGNSITGGTNDYGYYAMPLAEMLGDDYEVTKFGKGSSGVFIKLREDATTPENPNEYQFAYINSEQCAAALEYKPNIVIIKFGANDANKKNFEKYGKETFKADYKKLIAKFQALSTKPDIYICTPPPMYYGDGGFLGSFDDNVAKNYIQPAVREIAEELNLVCVDLYNPLKGHPEFMPGGNDWVHPDHRGHYIIAKEVYKAITGEFVMNPGGITVAASDISLSGSKAKMKNGAIEKAKNGTRLSFDVHFGSLPTYEIVEVDVQLNKKKSGYLDFYLDTETIPFASVDVSGADSKNFTTQSALFDRRIKGKHKVTVQWRGQDAKLKSVTIKEKYMPYVTDNVSQVYLVNKATGMVLDCNPDSKVISAAKYDSEKKSQLFCIENLTYHILRVRNIATNLHVMNNGDKVIVGKPGDDWRVHDPKYALFLTPTDDEGYYSLGLSPEARIGLSSANSTEVVGNRSGQIEDLDKWKIVTADEMKKQ
ncbi:GDSL-type esterase/lipase family protein [Bacteroides thetaiotaomicron]|uniref:GDSL-type esterase/lipase family protein n=1 Tax=Bacteroides thetaiotaomicron TaxID=818 RepID=UPI0034A3ACD8